jgi:hypothetical protein
VIRVAANCVRVLAWALLVVGLIVIALNPGVPSFPYALFWLGVMAAARGVSKLAPRRAVAIDLLLFFVCFLGLEISGLILWPSLAAFAVADALRRESASAA